MWATWKAASIAGPPFNRTAGREARRVKQSVFLFGRHAKRDAAVERHNLELDVEALAVSVLPSDADAGPVALVAAVADLVRDVRRGLWVAVVRVSHVKSPSFGFPAAPIAA